MKKFFGKSVVFRLSGSQEPLEEPLTKKMVSRCLKVFNHLPARIGHKKLFVIVVPGITQFFECSKNH